MPFQDVGKTAGAEFGKRPASHSLETFPFPPEPSLCLLLPSLLISQAGDFGSLQLYLVKLSPHLPHPLRISLWATLSTLMTAQAVLALGAMPVHSKEWLLSPLLKLNNFFTHLLDESVSRVRCEPTL